MTNIVIYRDFLLACVLMYYRDTPTSAGPNSFNKSIKGFSDPRGSWRNEIDD